MEALLKIYLAGPLFNDAERKFNAELAFMLRERGFEVFLPQETGPAASTNADTIFIFSKDIDGIDWADVLVAVLDGSDVDSGTAWEVGYAYAKGKPVFGLRTDFRTYGPAEKVNLMIGESVDDMYTGVYALIARLCRMKEGKF